MNNYYIKNKEKILKQNKAWRQANPEKCREMTRRWKEKNREKAREMGRISARKRRLNGKAQKCMAAWLDKRPLYRKNKMREYTLSKYGLTPKKYDEISKQQGGLCLVCKKDPSKTYKKNKILVVDHCHKTGKFRGLLCGPCNSAIGYFREDVEIIKSAVLYLSKDV